MNVYIKKKKKKKSDISVTVFFSCKYSVGVSQEIDLAYTFFRCC